MPYGFHASNVGIDPDGYSKEGPRRVRNPYCVCRNGLAPAALAGAPSGQTGVGWISTSVSSHTDQCIIALSTTSPDINAMVTPQRRAKSTNCSKILREAPRHAPLASSWLGID